jgi:hypothetical protein
MMMKSKRLSWAGHVASTGEMKISYKSLVKKKVETEDLGVEGRIILKFILFKWNRRT